MNWMRYIKRAAVRRVVWIVVGLLVYAFLSAFGVARAQSVEVYDSRGDAYAACNAVLQQALSAPGVTGPSGEGCTHVPDSPHGFNHYACAILWGGSVWSCNHARAGSPTTVTQWRYPVGAECPAGSEWDDDFKQCLGPCEGLSPLEGNVNTSLNPIVPTYCVNGCSYNASNPLCAMVEEGPTAGYWCNVMYNPTGGQCTAGPEDIPNDPNAPEECAIDEVRLANGDCSPRGDCPIGQHKVNNECHPIGRCPTGFVKSPDGSCSPKPCPSGQARGQDGTCKADTNQDGTPDEEGPDGDGTNKDGMEFSGGDSCAYPPTCSGDAIMCGQARIQWRIDCNTRRERYVEGGNHCDVFNAPICIGEDCDPVEHKQLTYAWKAACALEALVDRNSEGEGDGDDGGTAEMDVGAIGEGAVDGASGTIGDGGDPGEAFTDGSEGGGGDGELDTVGLGFGTSCPALPVINVLGVTLDFNEIGPELCDWMSLGGYIVLILSSLLSLRILAGGMNV